MSASVSSRSIALGRSSSPRAWRIAIERSRASAPAGPTSTSAIASYSDLARSKRPTPSATRPASSATVGFSEAGVSITSRSFMIRCFDESRTSMAERAAAS